jgi:hypothetical protein
LNVRSQHSFHLSLIETERTIHSKLYMHEINEPYRAVILESMFCRSRTKKGNRGFAFFNSVYELVMNCLHFNTRIPSIPRKHLQYPSTFLMIMSYPQYVLRRSMYDDQHACTNQTVYAQET